MQKYNCKNCGAELYWDSNANCLKCEYCETEYQVSDFDSSDSHQADSQNTEQTKTIPETAEEDMTATDDSDSLDLVIYKCSHCGAEIVTARSTVATTCAYCGRAISMTDKLVNNFKPEAVIPFYINEKKAIDIYKEYIHSTFLTPKTFGTESTLKKMKGIYVPFWLHTFTNHANVLLHCENIISKRRRNDKIIEHHMYHVTIDAQGIFTDIPTDGLKNLDNALMDAIEPFDYNKIQAFNPAYMAGFYAEEYNEDANDTLHRAKDRSNEAMHRQVLAEAGAYGVKSVYRNDISFSNINSRYAMLPVWLLNVEYHGKDYLYAINGETGKIAGKLPMSMKKLFLTALGSFGSTYIFITLLKFLLLIGGVL